MLTAFLALQTSHVSSSQAFYLLIDLLYLRLGGNRTQVVLVKVDNIVLTADSRNWRKLFLDYCRVVMSIILEWLQS